MVRPAVGVIKWYAMVRLAYHWYVATKFAAHRFEGGKKGCPIHRSGPKAEVPALHVAVTGPAEEPMSVVDGRTITQVAVRME